MHGCIGKKWGSGLKQKERKQAHFGRVGLYLGARLASAKWRRANPIDLREATKWNVVVPGSVQRMLMDILRR